MSGQVTNVVLIVVDALRTDRVGAYTGESLTPNIDYLAEEGEVFEKCYSCINATDPLLTTLMTGLYPTSHGVINHADDVTDSEKQYISGRQTLPMLLPDSHTSIGIDILGRWHARGFDQYLRPSKEYKKSACGRLLQTLSTILARFPDSLEQRVREFYRGRNDGNASLPATAEEITDLTIESINSAEEPHFILTHYWDTHIPYVPLEQHPKKVADRTYPRGEVPLSKALEPINGSPWGERLQSGILGDAGTIGDVCKKYDTGVAHVDRSIGRLIRTLKKNDKYEDTAIILLADHGESLTEHQIFFDHHGLYEPTTHAPCIIKAPGFSGREDTFIQHYDILPTILEMIGKKYDKDSYDGKSLVPSNKNRQLDRNAVYMEEALAARKRAIRTDQFTYIESLDNGVVCDYCGIKHAERSELYDRHSDPEEINNIIDERPGVASELSTELESWISNRPDPVVDSVEFDTDEVMDHLEDLGYR
jgi:arylsulfatase A-like enzyme